jgi:hypothetical protein
MKGALLANFNVVRTHLRKNRRSRRGKKRLRIKRMKKREKNEECGIWNKLDWRIETRLESTVGACDLRL